MTIFQEAIQAPAYLVEGVRYHLAGTLFTARPRMVQFPVCDRCNARCIMCNRWQKKAETEISLDKIREVFGNRLFLKVEEVNLHGGEPTLRRDLADICRIVQESCPRLKRIWISTNGFGRRRIEERMKEILSVLKFERLKELGISVSIDGLAETHDRIRGVRGGFEQCLETIEMLKRITQGYPAQIGMGTVIQPANLDQIEGLERLAGQLGVNLYFQPLMFDKFFNIADGSGLGFAPEETRRLRQLIETKLARGTSVRSFYWTDFLAMTNGARRGSPCAFDRYILSLYPTGEILPCSQRDWIMFGNVFDRPVDSIWYGQRARAVRKRMKKEVCPTCPSSCGVEFSIRKEFFRYLRYVLRKKLSHSESQG